MTQGRRKTKKDKNFVQLKIRFSPFELDISTSDVMIVTPREKIGSAEWHINDGLFYHNPSQRLDLDRRRSWQLVI